MLVGDFNFLLIFSGKSFFHRYRAQDAKNSGPSDQSHAEITGHTEISKVPLNTEAISPANRGAVSLKKSLPHGAPSCPDYFPPPNPEDIIFKPISCMDFCVFCIDFSASICFGVRKEAAC